MQRNIRPKTRYNEAKTTGGASETRQNSAEVAHPHVTHTQDPLLSHGLLGAKDKLSGSALKGNPDSHFSGRETAGRRGHGEDKLGSGQVEGEPHAAGDHTRNTRRSLSSRDGTKKQDETTTEAHSRSAAVRSRPYQAMSKESSVPQRVQAEHTAQPKLDKAKPRLYEARNRGKKAEHGAYHSEKKNEESLSRHPDRARKKANRKDAEKAQGGHTDQSEEDEEQRREQRSKRRASRSGNRNRETLVHDPGEPPTQGHSRSAADQSSPDQAKSEESSLPRPTEKDAERAKGEYTAQQKKGERRQKADHRTSRSGNGETLTKRPDEPPPGGNSRPTGVRSSTEQANSKEPSLPRPSKQDAENRVPQREQDSEHRSRKAVSDREKDRESKTKERHRNAENKSGNVNSGDDNRGSMAGVEGRRDGSPSRQAAPTSSGGPHSHGLPDQSNAAAHRRREKRRKAPSHLPQKNHTTGESSRHSASMEEPRAGHTRAPRSEYRYSPSTARTRSASHYPHPSGERNFEQSKKEAQHALGYARALCVRTTPPQRGDAQGIDAGLLPYIHHLLLRITYELNRNLEKGQAHRALKDIEQAAGVIFLSYSLFSQRHHGDGGEYEKKQLNIATRFRGCFLKGLREPTTTEAGTVPHRSPSSSGKSPLETGTFLDAIQNREALMWINEKDRSRYTPKALLHAPFNACGHSIVGAHSVQPLVVEFLFLVQELGKIVRKIEQSPTPSSYLNYLMRYLSCQGASVAGAPFREGLIQTLASDIQLAKKFAESSILFLYIFDRLRQVYKANREVYRKAYGDAGLPEELATIHGHKYTCFQSKDMKWDSSEVLKKIQAKLHNHLRRHAARSRSSSASAKSPSPVSTQLKPPASTKRSPHTSQTAGSHTPEKAHAHIPPTSHWEVPNEIRRAHVTDRGQSSVALIPPRKGGSVKISGASGKGREKRASASSATRASASSATRASASSAKRARASSAKRSSASSAKRARASSAKRSSAKNGGA